MSDESQGLENQPSTDTSTSDTPAASTATSTTQAAQPAVETTGSPQTAQAPYKPDYSYQVLKEKREMDEWARPLLTSKQVEDNLRKLFAGHGATEQLVKQREGHLKDFTTLKEQHDALRSQLADASEFVDRGDLDGFFSAIGLPAEKVLQYALQKVEYQNLSPEQKTAYDEFVTTQRNSTVLEKRLAQLEGRWQQEQVQTRTRDLDSVLNRPDVASAASAIGQRLSNPEALKEEAIWYGKRIWETTGQDITAEQAVDAVMKRYGMGGGQTAQPNGSKPAVIPNVGSHNVSPTKKKITSLDEMRKLGAAME